MKILVIGFGIAGMSVSFSFFREGNEVVVVDEGKAHTASSIAAGIVNPVVFKRLTMSWRASEFIPVAEKFYTDWENLLQKKFFHPKTILKLISSTNEFNFWKQKQNDTELIDFISLEKTPEILSTQLHETIAVGKIDHSCWLDIPLLHTEWKKFLLTKSSFREEKFYHENLVLLENSVEWKGEKFDKIIFCEGISAAQNPLLPEIPFQLSKGEMLLIESKNLSEEFILNKEIYILPIGNHLFKVGSTYNWKFENADPTEDGKQYLTDELKKILKKEFTILQHVAAIRPTVKERRPLVGWVKNRKLISVKSPIGILNGLGTKGIMLAPFFSQELTKKII